MPKDPRGYITVHDGMPNHPKVEPLTDKAFRLLVTSWCYCAANNTDGTIRDAVWKRRSTARARQELIDAGLVLLTDDGVEMRDYLQHQRSSAERAALREARANAGKLGGKARANAKQVLDKSLASDEQVPEQNPSKLAIYTEAESDSPSEPPALPRRDDVESVCTLLAERAGENSGRRLDITDAWRTSARLLIDKDGRDVPTIQHVIEWAARDEFWRSNVMAMPTLRKQFDKLYVKSGAANRKTTNEPRSFADQWEYPPDVLGDPVAERKYRQSRSAT